MTDVGRDVAKGFGSIQVWNDAFTIVEYPEARDFFLPGARDSDVSRAGVQAVLDELRQSLTWIRLAQCEPADELERIMDPQTPRLNFGITGLVGARFAFGHFRESNTVLAPVLP